MLVGACKLRVSEVVAPALVVNDELAIAVALAFVVVAAVVVGTWSTELDWFVGSVTWLLIPLPRRRFGCESDGCWKDEFALLRPLRRVGAGEDSAEVDNVPDGRDWAIDDGSC